MAGPPRCCATRPGTGSRPGSRSRATPDAGAVCAAVAALTGREPGTVRDILYGPAPRDDAALVALGRDIDALEGEVRTQ